MTTGTQFSTADNTYPREPCMAFALMPFGLVFAGERSPYLSVVLFFGCFLSPLARAPTSASTPLRAPCLGGGFHTLLRPCMNFALMSFGPVFAGGRSPCQFVVVFFGAASSLLLIPRPHPRPHPYTPLALPSTKANHTCSSSSLAMEGIGVFSFGFICPSCRPPPNQVDAAHEIPDDDVGPTPASSQPHHHHCHSLTASASTLSPHTHK